MTRKNNNIAIDTKIAFAFFDLGILFEGRNRSDLALQNYRKALLYDHTLKFVEMRIQELITA